LGPSIVVVIMVWLGYVEENLGNQTDDVALKMRYLVGVLYLLSAIIMYIGLGIIYNLDKKTTEQMKVELEYKRAEEA
ncbi:MAG: MFS transporter, partial [Firmicutes bacterium]|nr:MFS transporter [Bacillota bacterium]